MFLLFVFSGTSYGQTTATGCLLNNVVYTEKHPSLQNLGSPTYYRHPNVPLAADHCGWAPNIGSACTVCTGGFINVVGSGLVCFGPLEGKENTFSMELCPLDDFLPFLLIAGGGLGFFFLRKRGLGLG